eukprot:7374273-Pyramimonas_sp.AAC.1
MVRPLHARAARLRPAPAVARRRHAARPHRRRYVHTVAGHQRHWTNSPGAPPGPPRSTERVATQPIATQSHFVVQLRGRPT